MQRGRRRTLLQTAARLPPLAPAGQYSYRHSEAQRGRLLSYGQLQCCAAQPSGRVLALATGLCLLSVSKPAGDAAGCLPAADRIFFSPSQLRGQHVRGHRHTCRGSEVSTPVVAQRSAHLSWLRGRHTSHPREVRTPTVARAVAVTVTGRPAKTRPASCTVSSAPSEGPSPVRPVGGGLPLSPSPPCRRKGRHPSARSAAACLSRRLLRAAGRAVTRPPGRRRPASLAVSSVPPEGPSPVRPVGGGLPLSPSPPCRRKGRHPSARSAAACLSRRLLRAAGRAVTRPPGRRRPASRRLLRAAGRAVTRPPGRRRPASRRLLRAAGRAVTRPPGRRRTTVGVW